MNFGVFLFFALLSLTVGIIFNFGQTRKTKVFLKKLLVGITAVSLILWTINLPILFLEIPQVLAAVTETTPATNLVSSGQTIKASSFYVPLIGFALTSNAGESLNVVTTTVAG